jgi:hypothetical protein
MRSGLLGFFLVMVLAFRTSDAGLGCGCGKSPRRPWNEPVNTVDAGPVQTPGWIGSAERAYERGVGSSSGGFQSRLATNPRPALLTQVRVWEDALAINAL